MTTSLNYEALQAPPRFNKVLTPRQPRHNSIFCFMSPLPFALPRSARSCLRTCFPLLVLPLWISHKAPIFITLDPLI